MALNRWHSVSSIALSLWLSACSTPTSDPEQQVRALIQQAETAAEQRQTAALKAMVADQYRDRRGWGPRQLAALLHTVLARHRQINLFTVIQTVDVIEPTQARAEILVAMAGQKINNAQELSGLRAKLWHFQVWFKQDDEVWRVVRADWRPAGLGEFIP